jgi:SM-20-related protein
MWLNNKQISDSAISAYRKSLLSACPNHVVIDGLFNQAKLDEVIKVLQQPQRWQTQKHTYSALYVDNIQWQETSNEQRFVQRDAWQREEPDSNIINSNIINSNIINSNIAHELLTYLRGDEFMSVLSRIFDVVITDINVAEPEINTNYFRLGPDDFVEQHADDSPGREVCMLLYLNKEWKDDAGGELVFISKSESKNGLDKNGLGENELGENEGTISIAPLYNRCVLFDPSSKGSEHWVKKLNSEYADGYRFNVTSWYWSE